MGNLLTGDYEAVIQVSVRQINGLLATLHQNGESKSASATFPHSQPVRVGEEITMGKLEALEFGKWISAIKPQFSLADAQVGTTTLTADFPTLPPGAALLLKDKFSEWHGASLEPSGRQLTAGRALVQFSSPVVSLATGATAELTSSIFVRALYFPDPGSHELPEPIHGEVQVTYQPQPRTLASGERIFDVPFPAADSKIRFFPEPGTMNTPQAAEVEKQLRLTLRKGFRPMSVRLNGEFPFVEFIGVGSMTGAAGQALAIALPVLLSGPGTPGGNIHSLHHEFLGSNDFAIAVSKEAIGALMQPFINSINAAVGALRIEEMGATYKARFSSGPSLAFQNGQIVFSGRVEVETAAVLAPDGFISFAQALTLELDVAGQTASLKALGDPNVDESWFIPHRTALSIIRAQRDAGVVTATTPIRNILLGARNRLLQALKQFDTSANARYTATGITPDGVVISGAIDTKYHYPPVLQFTETNDRLAFTAFQSWIPGGRITNYHWSWVEATVVTTESGFVFSIPWFAKVKSIDDPHRFVLKKPVKIELPSQICLLLEGSQVTANGDVIPVTQGKACRVSSHEPILTLPPGWQILQLPKWRPDPAPDSILSDAIIGHLDAAAGNNSGRIATNSLVYFCDWRASDLPLQGLQRGLSMLRRSDATLSVIVVLPAGGLNMSRREFEHRLGRLRPMETRQATQHVKIDFTDDLMGNWARTFGTRTTPAAFLINGRGEYVWKHEGEIEPERLGAALEKFMIPTERAHEALLELSVQPGQRAPDLYFVDDRQNPVFTHKLAGSKVLVNFWQSWSNPCRLELRRLQELQNQATDNSLRVIGLCGDGDADRMREFREQNELSITLGHDPDQRLARTFGVRFWPTTVSINASGIVDGVQFGTVAKQRPIRDEKPVG